MSAPLMTGERFHALVTETLGGVDVAAGVPCSLLGPWLGTLDRLVPRHLRCTNEGEAVAAAVGAQLAGLRPVVYLQNSGLGNGLNPLTSLAGTFGVAVLLVIGYRGKPGGALDEPQHRLMGEATEPVLDAIGVDARLVDAVDVSRLVADTGRGLREGRSQAWLVPRGLLGGSAPHAAPDSSTEASVAASTLARGAGLPTRRDYVELLAKVRTDHVVSIVATTGMSGRELEHVDGREEDLYMVGSMGCAPSLSLGISLGAAPARRVVVLDGDGALLMRMESMVALARYAPSPVLHLVVDNGSYESTGAQPTLSGSVDFGGVAGAVGYASVAEVDSLSDAEATLHRLLRVEQPGAHLCVLRACSAPSPAVGRPRLEPPQQAALFADRVVVA